MYPIEDFTESVHFLKEVGDYFHDAIDAKDKNAKELQRNLAHITTEILSPLAATINNEVNVPVLRQFVDSLYPSVLELSKRRKNLPWVGPLVQLLLAVSQKQYFLNHWSIFLDYCLAAIKDSRYSRVCLESVSRLVWVYCVRHRCEANNTTATRLNLILKNIFPVGARHVTPRDQPSAYFVRILQFIAEVKLELAMSTIEELLGAAAIKTTNPERIQICSERQNIGLRAFVAIANSLQQCEKPPLPSNMSMPSGNTIRGKKTFLHSPLVEEQARTVGLDKYLPTVARALRQLLLTLDNLVGSTYLATRNQKIDDISHDKLDLLTLCVSAIPRILPEHFLRNYQHRSQILRIICQLTIHQNVNLQEQALRSLQSMIVDLPNLREDITAAYCIFILTDINDSWENLIEVSANNLSTLIEKWHECHNAESSCDDYSTILDRLEGFCVLLLANSSVQVRLSCVRILRSICSLSEKMQIKSPRLINLFNLCAAQTMNIASLRALIERYSGARAEDWREKLDQLIQFVWKNSTQVVPLQANNNRNTSLTLFFVFLDTFERIRSGPWETMASGNAVSFIGTQRNRTQPSAAGYLQQWAHYLLTALASAPNMSVMDATPTGTPDWLSNSGLLSATKRPDGLFKWVLDSLQNTNEVTKRELITSCLARTSQVSVELLLSELKLQDAAPNAKKRNKRRDQQKYQTARILAEMAELGKLNHPVKPNVIKYTLHCYEYWKSVNGEQELSEDRDQRRLNFVRLVVALIRNSPEDARKELFTTEQRSNLASLFGTWSPSQQTEYSTLSCMALIGRCSVLIAGTVELDQRFSYWLSRLLLLEENEQITTAVENITAIKTAGSVDALIIEFVSALLRANRDQLYIFSTELIHRCYHADTQIVNQRAFLALASVIGSEGWEGAELEQIEQIKVPLIVLSLANLSNESSQVSQAAQLFSQVLAKYLSAAGENIESVSSDLYPAMLASRLSSFTYPVVAEIFSRLQPRMVGGDETRRVEIDPLDQHNSLNFDNSLNFFYESRLLNLLIPWLKNIRLEGNCVSPESLFILNNLLYCSHRFSKRHPVATRHIWSALASNEANAMAAINCLAALARLDNLDVSIHELLQDVVREICLQAPSAFECIVTNLTNHGPVPFQLQPAAESPHWTVKKSKSDSPNGSVNSAKVESSIVVRERRTKTATAVELNNIRKPTSLVIRDRAVSNRDIYHSSGDGTDSGKIDAHKYYHLPFSMLLPDRFHSSKSSLGSITLLFIPNLLNDRRRRHDSVKPKIPSILVSSILYLDSSVAEIRNAARLSLLGLAHRQLMSCELNEGARVLLHQLENRGQLLNEKPSPGDSGYSTMSGEPSDLASPMSYESAVSSISASSGQSSLGMVHYLCTTRKFWIKELASPSFLPSSLRSSLQLKNLSESLLAVFGHNLRGDLAELTIASAINSPSQPITCRALQLYRSLLLPLTERVLSKLIAKLSEIVADPHEEKQAAVLEILDTFSMDIRTRTKNSEKLGVKDLASDSGSATVPKSHNRQQSGHRRSGSIFGNEFKNKENKLEIKSISAGAILSEKEKRTKAAQSDELDMPDEDVRILTIMVQVAGALLYSD